MLDKFINGLGKKALSGYLINYNEALRLADAKDDLLDDLMYAANRIRKHFKGNQIDFCSIINAKSGHCSEDCKFCAQSAHNNTSIKEHPLLNEEQLLAEAKKADKQGAFRYGIVTSGRGIKSEAEISAICSALDKIGRRTGINRCASLGALNPDIFTRLKKSGLRRYHHNLETSEDFFSKICSTHTYKERLNTAYMVKNAGLELCCGGIFGLGEQMKYRLDLAFTLRRLSVDSVPLNFLVPVKGTPLQDQPVLSAREILKIIALFRFILPDKDIKVCGGREVNLRDLQALIYYAGANGALLGNYLTVAGKSVKEDKQMIADLGLVIKKRHPREKAL